jgi:antirestriction protein ArdC
MPRSLSTGKPYRGCNVFLLHMEAAVKGYASPWWGTYRQIKERGGQVRKDETGTDVILWKPIQVDDKERPGKRKMIFFLRTFRVFNAEQADGLTLPPLPAAPPPAERIATCEEALAAYYSGETAPGLTFGGDRACYSPVQDRVLMPERETFKSPESYYGTLFHESVHSTGHAKRLARKDLLNFHRFGDPSYSREELVAEMGAAFLSGMTGIAAETLPQSAAYLSSWISVLKGDSKLIVHAAAQAQKAAELILGTTPTSESDSED